MTHITNVLGNVMTSHKLSVGGQEYEVGVLNAGHSYHGCCFALDWTGKDKTLPGLLCKFREFAKRRAQRSA